MTVSKDDKKVGISLGKNIIRDIYEVVEIAIYKREKNNFELDKLLDFEFPDVCKTFYFSNKNNEELIFFSKTDVFKINYNDDTKEKTYLYRMSNTLHDPPLYGVFSPDQRKFIVTSHHDILYVDMD